MTTAPRVVPTDTSEIPAVVPHTPTTTEVGEEERMSRADAPAPQGACSSRTPVRHPCRPVVGHEERLHAVHRDRHRGHRGRHGPVGDVVAEWDPDAITRTINDIAGSGANTIDAAAIFSFSRVVGISALLAVLEVILLTALATLFAFLYNLSVGVTGGLQVTLTDDS